jgi:N-acetylmuramoyl-L-alanine amidase
MFPPLRSIGLAGVAAAAWLVAAPCALTPSTWIKSAWAEDAAPAKPPDAPACDHAAFRVIIDVGHTAEVPGAKSARGAHEYDFNLRLAKLIQQQLTDAGFAKTTLLITSGPTQRGLGQRVARANNLGADLFLSIHHDSVPDKFLEKWTYEGEEHTYSDRFSGYSLFISGENPEYRASLLFGRLLGGELKTRGLQYAHQYTQPFMGRFRRQLVDADVGVYRYEHLRVLMATHMPAVLLEAGSIINRDEELAMGTPERQGLISSAVVDAINKFCAQRRPVPPVEIARRPAATRAAKPAMRPAAASSFVFPFAKRP